jgi:hypothetical protein
MKEQRSYLCEWYCLNPYMLSGTLTTAHGRPDVKIGTRVRVPDSLDNLQENKDHSFYVETVSHNWRFGASTKTSLGVTRGWIGTDASYLDAMEKAFKRFDVQPPKPEELEE